MLDSSGSQASQCPWTSLPSHLRGIASAGLDDVIVFGGGIIPREDRPALHEVGVRAMQPRLTTGSMLAFVEEATQRQRDGAGGCR